MRKVPLRFRAGPYETRKLIQTMMKFAPTRPLTLPDMRLRANVLKALAATPTDADHFLLDEVEWKVLHDATNTFPWNAFDHDLMQTLEDIVSSEMVSRAASGTTDLSEIGSSPTPGPVLN
jgi:hypothetical protein